MSRNADLQVVADANSAVRSFSKEVRRDGCDWHWRLHGGAIGVACIGPTDHDLTGGAGIEDDVADGASRGEVAGREIALASEDACFCRVRSLDRSGAGVKSAVYTRIPRCPASLVEQASLFPVADLHEAMGGITGRVQLMSPHMRPVGAGQRMAGQAVTSYNYPGDNLMIHAALNIAKKGDVLVLCNGGISQGALWGDVAATYAAEKGIAGVVADGPVRDTASLREMGCQVWSTIVSPAHPEKRGPGAVNVPVVCDGVRVMPGDIVVADDDGVVVLPLKSAAGIMERARARNATEAGIRKKIRAGGSLFEILQMQAFLDRAGVEIVDAEWKESAGLQH